MDTVKNTSVVGTRYEDTHFVDTQKPVWNYSLFTDEAIRNFQQGTLYNAYQFFGNKQIKFLVPRYIFCRLGAQCYAGNGYG